MLASGVLPLLRRRVDDHPPRPEARRMGAPVRDRRRPARGSSQAEVVFFFDQWRNSPLASLNRLLDESHAIAGGQSARVDPATATWPTRLWTLGQQYGGARILFVFDHFEQLLESPKEDANAQQFVEGWVQALQEPGLNANFLVVLADRAWPRLQKLGERIPAFDEVRAFEVQAGSARQASEPLRAAGAERQTEMGAESGVVDFEASLRAKLSEVATLARLGHPVPAEFQASLNAVLFEVRRSARREAPPSPPEAPSSAAEEDLRIAEAIEAFGKADVVRAAEAQRFSQTQRAAEAEAARAAQAQRVANAEAKRLAQEAAAAEVERRAEELRRVEAERAAEVQRVAQARRAAEAAQRAEAQRAAGVEAKRVVEAAAADEASRIAEVAGAAAAAKATLVSEAVELTTKAARGSEARWSAGYNSAPIASPSIAAASPGTALRSAIKWGGATLAAMLVAAMLWPSVRQQPIATSASSPEAPTPMSSTRQPTPAPIVAAPGRALEVSSAPIQTGVPSATAETASAPPVASPGAPPETTEPGLFTVWINAGGSDARIASELARAIGGGGAAARAVTAATAVDAVESLRAPRSLAIAQYEALRAARQTASAPPLRVLAPLYAEEVVFIVRADSQLKFIHELRGRRVNIGSARDGSSQTVREIYRQMFGTAMTEPSQLGKDEALAELVGFRSIDAMVLVEAQPSAWLASLHPNTARGIRLLRLDRKQPEDRRVLQEFQTSVLRSGPGIKRGEGIPTLATMSYLVVSGKDDADAKQLTDMVRALCRELPRLRAGGHPKWRELQPSVNRDTGWPVVAAGQSALKSCVSDRPAPTFRRAPRSHSKR
ncbi:MAG: TAXI family TRAP transporter solute-binding subunit [Burkholderiales bacterium]